MDKKEQKWQIFEKTGLVKDYLQYCKIEQENKNAFQDNRNSTETEELSQ